MASLRSASPPLFTRLSTRSTPIAPSFGSYGSLLLKCSGFEILTLHHPLRHKKNFKVRCAGKGFGSDSFSESAKTVKSGRDEAVATKAWEFEDLMIVWDGVFEKSCEQDLKRIKRIKQVAEIGNQIHGRGCVVLNDNLSSTKNLRPSNADRKNDLIEFDEDLGIPACISQKWTVEYLPRAWLYQLANIGGQGSPEAFSDASGQKPFSPNSNSVPLVSINSLIPILRSLGGDFSRLLTLTSEESNSDENVKSSENGDDDETIVMGIVESPYSLQNNEVVLLLTIDVDGKKVSGADVIEPYFEFDHGRVSMSQCIESSPNLGINENLDKLRYRVRGMDQYIN